VARPRITAALWVAAAIIFTVWSVSASAQQIFAPGKVDSRHEKRIHKCSGCHDALQGVPDLKCIKCHRNIIAERKRRLTGHAKTSAACTACHKIHGNTLTANLLSPNADTRIFDHDGTRPCVECHLGPTNHFGPACADCHTVGTWKGAKLNHPPMRRHSPDEFPCAACHPNGYTSSRCWGCHNGQGERGY